ncbi:hypothetical protein B0H13DRAFT_2383287 [Mycena leptocephala]|nr:hypothetical protein B0H13DRAFT_2383287 [Mycena leptocephala]
MSDARLQSDPFSDTMSETTDTKSTPLLAFEAITATQTHPASGLQTVIGSAKTQRRADGQLGRFDPISPIEIDEEDAVYAFVHECWELEPDSGFHGRLDPFFVQRLVEANANADQAMEAQSRVQHTRPLLWSDHPQEPWSSSVEALKSVRSFEDTVDLVREVQRGIHEKRAWVKMAVAWIQGGLLEASKKGTVVPANDGFMGSWVHEITELDLYFLLTKAAVPCFFIHELTNREPPSELVALDFVKWTAVVPQLDPEYCPYNCLATSSVNGQVTASEEMLALAIRAGRSLTATGLPFPVDAAQPRAASVDEETEDVVVDEPVSPGRRGNAVLTPFLKFPGLNDTFAPNNVRAWLDGVNRKVPGPRVDYYVEFESAEAALKSAPQSTSASLGDPRAMTAPFALPAYSGPQHLASSLLALPAYASSSLALPAYSGSQRLASSSLAIAAAFLTLAISEPVPRFPASTTPVPHSLPVDHSRRFPASSPDRSFPATFSFSKAKERSLLVPMTVSFQGPWTQQAFSTTVALLYVLRLLLPLAFSLLVIGA